MCRSSQVVRQIFKHCVNLHINVWSTWTSNSSAPQPRCCFHSDDISKCVWRESRSSETVCLFVCRQLNLVISSKWGLGEASLVPSLILIIDEPLVSFIEWRRQTFAGFSLTKQRATSDHSQYWLIDELLSLFLTHYRVNVSKIMTNTHRKLSERLIKIQRTT